MRDHPNDGRVSEAPRGVAILKALSLLVCALGCEAQTTRQTAPDASSLPSGMDASTAPDVSDATSHGAADDRPVDDATGDATAQATADAGAAAGLSEMVFSRDWVPGRLDVSGRPMAGTETLWLVAHQGMVFAGMGVWNINRTASHIGATVLVKRAAGVPWEIDGAFGASTVRVSALAVVSLATDRQGRPLATPFRRLVAGVQGVVHLRDDATGAWVASPIPGSRAEIRQVFTHRDRVTGVDALFAALSTGQIVRALHDPSAPGGLAWDGAPELTDQDGRIMAASELGGQAYIAVDLSASRPDNGGLLRRVDGPAPRWEVVGRWGTPPRVGVDATGAWLRGLTAVPDPSDPARQVLLAGRESAGVIERISSDNPARVDAEADVSALLERAWGCQRSRRYVLIAYNDMPSGFDPGTGRAVNLIGLGMGPPTCLEEARARSAWLLVRDGPGDYRVLRVPEVERADPPAADGLRAVRTIVASPFASERGRVWYLGGFDAAQGPHVNTAWIYRGEVR